MWGNAIVFGMYSDHTEVEAKSVLKQIIGRLNYSLQGNIYDYNLGGFKEIFPHLGRKSLSHESWFFFSGAHRQLYTQKHKWYNTD